MLTMKLQFAHFIAAVYCASSGLGLAVGQTFRPCAQRTPAGPLGMVCVCNATYCDDMPALGTLTDSQAAVYTSNFDGLRFARTTVSWTHGSRKATDGREAGTIHINPTSVRQSIIGFGGAFTDSAGINFQSLSAGARANLMQSYFGPNGLQYSLGRVPIASCDFSTHEYSYDDVTNDFALTNFNLTMEDYTYKIPYILWAKRLTGGDLKLFASPWSAPGWMKTNGHMRGGGTLRGFPNGNFYVTWANYFVKFLQAYQLGNVTFWGITVQNEPNTGLDPTYSWQTMYLSPEGMASFVADLLGPTLRNSTVGRDTAIMCLDDGRLYYPDQVDRYFSNEYASAYTAGIAVHWYMDDLRPASLLTKTHQRHPSKFILGTEACNGYLPLDSGPIIGDWLRGQSYAHSIIEDLNNYVAGWTDWNLALDLNGGPNWVANYVDSPILVNATSDEFYKQPMYYAMGHFSVFSKFIRPNSRMVDMSISINNNYKDDLEGIAVSTPANQRVMVIFNKSVWDTITVTVQDSTRPGQSLPLSLTPQSFTTVVWNKI